MHKGFFECLSFATSEREERIWFEAYECSGDGNDDGDGYVVEENDFFIVRRPSDDFF